jgi:hypothetical protein
MSTLVEIEGFPDYVVGNDGRVLSVRSGRTIRPSITQRGVAKITLSHRGVAYTKSLARIVAKAHLYNDFNPEIFDTPIHLDNDPKNNHVDNLAWRPKWFAVKYHRQYWNLEFRTATVRVEDTTTGEVYGSIMEPCQMFGLLFIDVLNSCTRGTYVFPTWKVFNFA